MNESITAHFFVSGRVQGVFFRASASREARRLGVCGWVRNLDDGRVEGMAQGSLPGLAAFRAWLHQGPPGARVDDVEWTETGSGVFSGFQVR